MTGADDSAGDGSEADDVDTEVVVFEEFGARWRTLLFGPIFCVVALIIELSTGPVVHWLALAVIALILVGFTYVQVIAARRHGTVQLTTSELRQGTESVDLTEIVSVYPPADYDEHPNGERWEIARPLGELSSVPRKRHGIGLRLRGGGVVQAWAKDDDRLREQLLLLRGEGP